MQSCAASDAVSWLCFSYPDSWYEDITSNPKFFSLAATYSGKIIGMIVSEVKTRSRCNREVCTFMGWIRGLVYGHVV